MRPVEMNGIVNRTQDYAQLKHNEEQKPTTDQANFQTQFNKQVERSSETVVKQRNSEWKDEKFDAKEKGKNTYFSNRRKKEKKEEDGDVKKRERVSFDMKI